MGVRTLLFAGKGQTVKDIVEDELLEFGDMQKLDLDKSAPMFDYLIGDLPHVQHLCCAEAIEMSDAEIGDFLSDQLAALRDAVTGGALAHRWDDLAWNSWLPTPLYPLIASDKKNKYQGYFSEHILQFEKFLDQLKKDGICMVSVTA